MWNGVMIVVFIIFFIFFDGLDLSELLCFWGGGRVIGDWLIRLGVLGIEFLGMDSGFLIWEDELGILVLLFCCVLEVD